MDTDMMFKVQLTDTSLSSVTDAHDNGFYMI